MRRETNSKNRSFFCRAPGDSKLLTCARLKEKTKENDVQFKTRQKVTTGVLLPCAWRQRAAHMRKVKSVFKSAYILEAASCSRDIRMMPGGQKNKKCAEKYTWWILATHGSALAILYPAAASWHPNACFFMQIQNVMNTNILWSGESTQKTNVTAGQRLEHQPRNELLTSTYFNVQLTN